MFKNIPTQIPKVNLDSSLLKLHKEGLERSDFGLDNSSELIDGGFGLYSSADMKKTFGPIKTEYFRIGLIKRGTVSFDIGLESFRPVRNYVLFGFPGQVFSLHDVSDDFLCYYLLFSEQFIAESVRINVIKKQFPFLNYSGTQCFPLTGEAAAHVEDMIMTMNQEIQARKADLGNVLRLYIQLIFIEANRCYGNEMFSRKSHGESNETLFGRYVKLVSQHFLSVKKVADYAGMLCVSADHLNRSVRAYSGKTAHELIDEMVLIEAKANLRHGTLSVSEIAYLLEFTDPSHFSKFFKKRTGHTPQQYRGRSE